MFTKQYFNYNICTQWNIMQQFKGWDTCVCKCLNDIHRGERLQCNINAMIPFMHNVVKCIVSPWRWKSVTLFLYTEFNLLRSYFKRKNQSHLCRVTLKIILKLSLLKLNSVSSGKLFSSPFSPWGIWVAEAHGYHGIGKRSCGLSLRHPRIPGLFQLVSRIGHLLLPSCNRPCLALVFAPCTLAVYSSWHVLRLWIHAHSNLPHSRPSASCHLFYLGGEGGW